MLHEEQEPSWVGRPPDRPTFSISLVMTEDFLWSTEQSTAHLGRSTERLTAHLGRLTGQSTDSRVITVFRTRPVAVLGGSSLSYK